MFCTWNKKLSQTNTKSSHVNSQTGIAYSIMFGDTFNNFQQLIMRNIQQNFDKRQIDFVFITQSCNQIVSDILSALNVIDSPRLQITVQLHVITPLKDLLGNGTSIKTLEQQILTKDIQMIIRKRMQLNTCLVVNIQDDYFITSYRFFAIEALKLGNVQLPNNKKIVCIDFRRMQNDYLDYTFKLYGQMEPGQNSKEKVMDILQAEIQNENMHNTSQTGKSVRFSESLIEPGIQANYSQQQLQNSINYALSQLKRQKQHNIDDPAVISNNIEQNSVLTQNLSFERSFTNQDRLSQVNEQLQNSQNANTVNNQTQYLVVDSMEQLDRPGRQLRYVNTANNSNLINNKNGLPTTHQIADSADPPEHSQQQLSIHQLQVQLKTLQQKYNALREEKMVVENGKNKLIEENVKFRREIQDFQQTQRNQQLRIQRLEKELRISRDELKQVKNQEINKNGQSEEDKNLIKTLTTKLKNSETRVQQLMEQTKELRAQITLLNEQVYQQLEDDGF